MTKGAQQKLVQNSFTINGWATITGLDPRTVKNKVNASDIKPVNGTEYDSRDLFAAMTAKADIEESKARKLSAEAELAEMERDHKKASLLDHDQIKDAYTKTVQIISQRVGALPSTWSARANPQNPEKAHAALQEAVRHILAPLEPQ
jgi:hypothetical protein